MPKCAFKLMQVALLEDERGDEGETEENDEVEGDNERGVKDYGTLELPLYSISGMTQPQTMKLRGRIQNEEAVVMIDSGASHNFVSRKLEEKLGMKIDEAVRFGVCLGDGTRYNVRGYVRD
ncbi:hypothetical protein F511_20236 [Dorcoceras hygrometricum]|uniref:Uncharacterized protein n=1 Tax=Dorcoceras hygrometricum TaxID=472368 RepID=A0A2Z7ART1_9LAMI|nr:hypothetical protein F511_20236 [Dorcoceras hygrometricum]